ncbi:uncharacterized protein F5Z01DRAFT_307803 [Emericellopsis atlantica]|uniref:Capsule polysaccharide biosynthesis protein n=1 Tax=Emericellopsis atlantica TaxID=2614577 RepID=A0A9P8CT56_9HYPO|nr:uncharacterized protein F5Z01DRAFT_307803 [Emericellopsis atlantica]KAG9257895.1 hypothetical protein F5Z01DRAFT_307803 [Emericellopsis atlantica]
MVNLDYPMPNGLYVIPDDQLDLRPDAQVDQDLLHPRPVSGLKNVWFFWHSGFLNMHPYTQRNVRAWHRRFSKHGWTIRVLDREEDSPLNIAKYLDVKDPNVFPKSFIEGAIGGSYGLQHTSDLVRWPLLNKYGGVYADVGMMQIGDLDRLWNKTLGDPDSPYEILSYDGGEKDGRNLTNYFLCSRPNNPLFTRCHKLLLKLWNEDGGRTSTDGMHANPLLKEIPHLGYAANVSIELDGATYGPEEVAKMLTDYIIQGQVIRQVMGLQDDEDGWNGPEYCAKHIYAIEFMAGSQLINEYTTWNGVRAFELMSLSLPKDAEEETPDQKCAREIVEGCLTRSWGFKLAHGLILKILGPTLGSLWRQHPGSDAVPGTYADWLRKAMVYWNQKEDPEAIPFKKMPPTKIGPLLRES